MKTLIKWMRSHKEILIVSIIFVFFMVCFYFASQIGINERDLHLKRLGKDLEKEIVVNKNLRLSIQDSIDAKINQISNKKIDTIKQIIVIQLKANEVEINNIKHLSTDSTIVLLSEYLSLQSLN